MPVHGLRFESQHDRGNTASFVATESGLLTVSVAEEQWMDSFHVPVECSFEMRAAEAIRLRDWLNTQFPPLQRMR